MNDSMYLPPKSYKHGDFLSLSDAAKLFASHDMRPHDTKRGAIDRWRKKITSATDTGGLTCYRQSYKIEELANWALGQKVDDPKSWPTKLQGLPRAPFVEAITDSATIADEVYDHARPKDMDGCDAEVRRLEAELRELRHKQALLHEENVALRPKAEKYDRICERNRESGGIRHPKDTDVEKITEPR